MSGLSNAFTEALGLTLMDSLWQGALILLICTIGLSLMRSKAARWRYRLVLMSTLALPIAGVITFISHYEVDAAVSLDAFEVNDTFSQITISGQAEEALAGAPGIIERWQSWAQANAQWVVSFWAIGLALFAIRLSGGFYMVRSLRISAQPISDNQWTEKLKTLCDSLNISLPVQLKESVKVNSPIVIGYLKPIIIFPLGLLQGIPTDQVEAILLHELAHVKRHDYLINLLVSLLQAVYFYHPAFWWLQKQLDAEREYSCDDLVLMKMNRLSLVKALTAVKEFQMSQYTPALGFASQKNQLLKRVERIMKKKTKTNWLGGLISMCALLLSFTLMSYRSSSPLEEMPAANIPLEEEALKMDVQYIDSLTVEQAIMQLLNQKDSKLILELDGNGRLVDMMRNEEPIGQGELRIFQQAHAKIREYNYAESKLTEEQEAYTMRLKEREQFYRRRVDALNEKQRVEDLSRKIQENQRLLRELQESQARNEQLSDEVSHNLDELLRYYPGLIKEYKEGKYSKWADPDSLVFTMYPSQGHKGKDYAKFKITIAQLKKRLAYLQKNSMPLVSDEKNARLEMYVKEMKTLERKLYENQTLTPGKYEYNQGKQSQTVAARHLNSQNGSLRNALIVIDGEVKENWTVADIKKNLDPSLAIKALEVISRKRVTTDYKKFMKESHEGIIKVTTEPGKGDFQRPNVQNTSSQIGYLAEMLAVESKLVELESAQEKVATETEREELIRRIQELRALSQELKERGYVRSGKYDFNDNEGGEKAASEILTKTARSQEKPLVVVDGEIKEDWGILDLNKMDPSLRIEKINAIRASKVTNEKYLKYMKGRDYLFRVTTKPGGKKYMRPEVVVGQTLSPEEVEELKMKDFTQTMLDRLAASNLTNNGWSNLSLSQDKLVINGQKQSKKVHKEYLKLYQKIMGKKLAKGQTIDLQE